MFYCLSFLLAATPAVAEKLEIDFDTIMTHLWKDTAWWEIIMSTEYLPEYFTLMPGQCDINGGFDISVKPVELYPNGMLDSDEFSLIAAILADPGFDATAQGGTSHEQVYATWTHNFNQMRIDLGCCVGGPENVFEMFPGIEYLLTAMITLGDQDSLAFPILLFDLVVNNDVVAQLIHDPHVRPLDLANYITMREYLAWCGDADGDGCTNYSEYVHFYGEGGRSAYLQAALDNSMTPPGCTGDDRLCDGSGGLYGEYFDSRTHTNLALTRIDQQVSFNWGRGAPAAELGVDNFSICWTGWIIPDYTEEYTFYTRTDDGVRLWIEGELLINKWVGQSATTHASIRNLPLVAGQEYAVQLDFYEAGGDAVAWLGWSSPSQTNGEARAIYEMNLKPGTGLGERTNKWFKNPDNGLYYKLITPQTWVNGQNIAEGLGGNLASINSAEENSWIHRIFGTNGNNFYIGATDRDEEGKWCWVDSGINFWLGDGDGEAVDGHYANWASGEPNDYGDNENYGAFYHGAANWNDLNGNSALPCLIQADSVSVVFNGPLPGNALIRANRKYELYLDIIDEGWGPLQFQWTHNGVDIPGATLEKFTIASVKETDEGLYACKVTDGNGVVTVSESVMLMIDPGDDMPVASWQVLLLTALILVAMTSYILKHRKVH
jgi:hypothetical protein